MDSILERIFEGDLFPNEHTAPDDPDYRELTRKVSDEMERFKKELSAENYSYIEEMEETINAVSAMEVKQAFCNGMILGIKIMIEVNEKSEK